MKEAIATLYETLTATADCPSCNKELILSFNDLRRPYMCNCGHIIKNDHVNIDELDKYVERLINRISK